jgi:hypothetical protein
LRTLLKGLAFIGCIGLTILSLPLFGGLLLGTAFWLGSQRTIYQRVESPDGKYEARVQFDDAGAISGWAKTVFVRRAWLPLDTPWLSCPAFWGEGTDHIRLSWPDNHTLVVVHGFKPDDASSNSTCGSVRIRNQFDPKLISDQP